MLDRARDGSPPINLNWLRFFKQVLGGSDAAIVASDLERRINYANSAAERLLGWQSDELLGQSLDDLLDDGGPPIDLEALRGGGEWAGERLSRRRDGTTAPTRVSVSAVRNNGGVPVGFMVVLLDNAESQQRRARLASLAAIGAALNAQSDPEPLLRLICREARTLFQTDGAYLARLDERAGELVGVVGDGLNAAAWVGRRVPLAEPAWAITTAARERRAVVRPRRLADGGYSPYERPAVLDALFQVRAALAAPLLRQDRLLGVLVCTDTCRVDRLGPEDVELAQAYAELAAAALEDARLHAAERAKNERLRALARVSQLLASSLERRDVFEAIVSGAQRLLGADEVVIWLLETPGGPLRPAHWITSSAHAPEPAFDLQIARMGQVVFSGQPWQIADINEELKLPHGRTRFGRAAASGLRGCLEVPLIARGRPLGGIAIFSREARTFDAEEVGLAQAFGSQAALAVQNAETLARERQGSRVERLLRQSDDLSPERRQRIEHLLESAEWLVDLSTRAHAAGPRSRGRADGATK